jgi:hypothetical protein
MLDVGDLGGSELTNGCPLKNVGLLFLKEETTFRVPILFLKNVETGFPVVEGSRDLDSRLVVYMRSELKPPPR